MNSRFLFSLAVYLRVRNLMYATVGHKCPTSPDPEKLATNQCSVNLLHRIVKQPEDGRAGNWVLKSATRGVSLSLPTWAQQGRSWRQILWLLFPPPSPSNLHASHWPKSTGSQKARRPLMQSVFISIHAWWHRASVLFSTFTCQRIYSQSTQVLKKLSNDNNSKDKATNDWILNGPGISTDISELKKCRWFKILILFIYF